MPVAADIMEHFARIETIFQCIKRKTIFRLTQNTKQVKHLLIVGPSIVACHAAHRGANARLQLFKNGIFRKLFNPPHL